MDPLFCVPDLQPKAHRYIKDDCCYTGLHAFQDKFIDVARFYYKRTGESLPFVPMYIAPRLRKMYLGEPILFDPQAPIDSERERICREAAEQITHIAASLPEHTVVPYRNIPRKDYPKNKPIEVYQK